MGHPGRVIEPPEKGYRVTTINTPFLAPPTAEKETPAPRESNRGETAMRRLRNPFTVAAEVKPRPDGA